VESTLKINPSPLRIALAFEPVSPWEIGIIHGAISYSQSRNWNFFGYSPMMTPLGELESWRGDGIISIIKSEERLLEVAQLGLPVVDVAGAASDPRVHRVLNDDKGSGDKAGDYLKKRGFRDVVYCGVELGWSDCRELGLRESLAPVQISSSLYRSLAWWENNRPSRELQHWLAQLAPSTAIVCCHDSAALKVAMACREAEIAVPEKLSILGFDNNIVLCELAQPPLSSVALDVEAIGYRAGQVLDDLMKGKKVPHESLLPSGEVVERASSMHFPVGDKLVSRAMGLIQIQACEGLSVNQLIGQLPVSRRNLELRFKKAIGKSPFEAITVVRLEKAVALLTKTQETIAGVGERCGYPTPARFYSAFRKAFGCTPDQYRRK
jgi:LacI family transcriptional regulator